MTLFSLVITSGLLILYFSIGHIAHLYKLSVIQDVGLQKVEAASISGLFSANSLWADIPSQNQMSISNAGITEPRLEHTTPAGTTIQWAKTANELVCYAHNQSFRSALIAEYVVTQNKLIYSTIRPMSNW